MIQVLLKHLIFEQAISVMFDGFNKNLQFLPIEKLEFYGGQILKMVSTHLDYNYAPLELEVDSIIGCTTQYKNVEVMAVTSVGIDISINQWDEIYHFKSGTLKKESYTNLEYDVYFIFFDDMVQVVE